MPIEVTAAANQGDSTANHQIASGNIDTEERVTTGLTLASILQF
jgi:hypothetical protein